LGLLNSFFIASHVCLPFAFGAVLQWSSKSTRGGKKTKRFRDVKRFAYLDFFPSFSRPRKLSKSQKFRREIKNASRLANDLDFPLAPAAVIDLQFAIGRERLIELYKVS
jgi:hypothetical protein